MAPEEFSVEDVQQLQKFIRELHVENMQKTLAYIKLEHAYHSLKGMTLHFCITLLIQTTHLLSFFFYLDEVAALTKRATVVNRRNEGLEGHEYQTATNPAEDFPKIEELVKANLCI